MSKRQRRRIRTAVARHLVDQQSKRIKLSTDVSSDSSAGGLESDASTSSDACGGLESGVSSDVGGGLESGASTSSDVGGGLESGASTSSDAGGGLESGVSSDVGGGLESGASTSSDDGGGLESDTSNGIIDECKTIPVQLDHLYPGARISCEEYSVTLFRCSKSIALLILVSKIYSNYLLKFYPSQILCLDHSMFFSRALLILILILLFTVAVCIAHKVKGSFYTFLPVHIFCSCLSKHTSINVASDAFAALHSTRWQTVIRR